MGITTKFKPVPFKCWLYAVYIHMHTFTHSHAHMYMYISIYEYAHIDKRNCWAKARNERMREETQYNGFFFIFACRQAKTLVLKWQKFRKEIKGEKDERQRKKKETDRYKPNKTHAEKEQCSIWYEDKCKRKLNKKKRSIRKKQIHWKTRAHTQMYNAILSTKAKNN